VRVSVVIPCFNYGRYLAEAVESVLAQTISPVEVIVVDDGSTDNSRDVATDLIAAHPEAAIRLIAQPNSGSPGAARNAGIAEVRADYVLCLDADDRLDPGYLEACARALDANPGAAVAYGDIQLFGDENRLHQPPTWNTRVELDCNFLGTASLFRRMAWEQVGGYDTEIGYEDWDFWIGLIEHGWVGVKAPGARWHYRVHSGGVYDGHTRKDQEIKARIVLKHPSLYSDAQRRWAAAVIDGEPAALATGTQTGAIPVDAALSHHPQLPDTPQTPYTIGQSPAAVPPTGVPVRSVCMITKDYPPTVPGGIPRAVQMQAHNLVRAGVEVHVITKSQTGAEGTREDNGVVVHEIPEPGLAVPPGLGYLEIPLWSFVVAAKFQQLDATVKFDVVETPDYRGEALHLAPRPETALIVWLHSTMMVVWNCEPGYVRTPSDDAWHALEMAALERADLLLAPSRLLLDTTAEFLGDRMRPAELMPYLFDSDQFPVRPRDRGDGPIEILFYGRLEARKNPELALHALAAARARGLDARLTMLGRNNEGYHERVLAPLQAELGLHDVTYIPHVDLDRLRAQLARTDVAILASRFDNSPLTIFEALSSGVPVITSEYVGTASWIEPENGLLVLPIEDPAEFGRRAAEVFADPEWMASGPRAAARMREKFSPAGVTERLLDSYRRLMATKRPVTETTRETILEPTRETTRSRTGHPTDRRPIDGTRRHAVLAFADELVADPELLQAWSQTFDGDDDITLVIHASGWTEAETASKLGPLVAGAGLDGDDAADLLALAVPPSPESDARLVAGTRAILTRRTPSSPFDALPTVDAQSLQSLRQTLALSAADSDSATLAA
jgi:glycosyltransferase involved in cell wall biosynthesis